MFGFRFLAVLGVLAPMAGCTPSPSAVSNSGFVPANDGAGRRTASPQRKSWIAPTAKRAPLLYVSNVGTASVTIYTITGGETLKLVGELFGFSTPGGECVDGKGNVFVPDTPARIIDEYAHGAVLPKAVIADPDGQPYTCAIDPKSGRLAVANFENSSGAEPGNVIIYPSLSGTPSQYADPRLYVPLYCDFDRKGNLFVSAYDSSYRAVLSELPKNGSAFTIFSITGGSINLPGGLAWNGSQLLFGDLYDPKTSIRRIGISGSTANIVGTIPLSNTQTLAQFTLFGSGSSSILIAPDYDNSNIGIYSFPSGSPIGTMTDGISQPFGAVISN